MGWAFPAWRTTTVSGAGPLAGVVGPYSTCDTRPNTVSYARLELALNVASGRSLFQLG
jgi:hypothetical protein